MSNILNNTTSLQEVLEILQTKAAGTDTSDATATADEIFAGETAYAADGKITGTFTIEDELTEQNDLISQIKTALEGKASASEPVLQSKTVTPSASAQTVTPDSNYDGLSKVTVNAIPSTYVKPTTKKSATTYTPTTSNQTIAAGTYCSGTQTIKGDANLKAENIAEGVSIFGVTGTHSGGSSGGGSIETCTVTISTGTASNTSDGTLSNVGYIAIINGIETLVYDNPGVSTMTIDNIKKGSLLTFTSADGNSYIRDITGGIQHLVGVGYCPMVYYITADGTVHTYKCFVRGTKISLSNGSTKEVQDIDYNDELLVWDFDNGCFTSANPIWIKKLEIATQYYHCVFEDGHILDVVGGRNHAHRIFCLDTNRFEYANDCVGKIIATQGGNVKLISCELVDDNVEFYNVITNYHMNLFANEILTSTGLNNIYPIENMKFVKTTKTLIPIGAFKNCPKDYYYGMRLGEQVDYSMEELNEKIKTLVETALPNGK